MTKFIDNVTPISSDWLNEVDSKLAGGISVKQFGVDTTGTINSVASLTAAVAAAITGNVPLQATGGIIRIDSDVNLRGCALDMPNTSIVCYSGAKVLLGGDARRTDNPTQSLLGITRHGGPTATPSCRIMGAKDQTINLMFCDYPQLYADTSTGNSGSDYSIAYSTFNFNKWDTLELTNNLNTPNSPIQWINENTFNGKRITNLIVSGTYSHNHNIFVGGCFESSNIDFQVGNSNQIMDARFEAANTVNFASGTWANRIVVSWESNQRGSFDPATLFITLTDAGEGNQIVRAAHLGQRRIPLLQISMATCRVHSKLAAGTGNNFDFTGNLTSLEGVDVGSLGINTFAVNQNRKVFGSNQRIPVDVGDAIEFNSDQALFRCRIYLYDASGNQITNTDPNAADYLRTDADTVWNVAGYFAPTSNTAHTLGIVRNSIVKSVRIEVISGSASTDIPIWYCGIHLITSKQDAGKSALSLMRYKNPSTVGIAPTRGFAPTIGQVVMDTTGGMYQSSFALDTTTTAASLSGATVVNLTSTTGMAIGDVIGVEQTDGSAFWGTVSSITGLAVTLSGALPAAVNSGARVVVNRWLPFKKMAPQADSTATDVATLKSDFDALLAKLRTAGLM